MFAFPLPMQARTGDMEQRGRGVTVSSDWGGTRPLRRKRSSARRFSSIVPDPHARDGIAHLILLELRLRAMGWGHGSYAAGVPVISAQARKARARAARYRVAEARSRRRWKRFPIGFRAEENHWLWPANVKRFIWRKRCRLAHH